jgi:hypothetical protein
MGFLMVYGNCAGCGQPFSYNPNFVPSVRDRVGVRQAICINCVGIVNRRRVADGLAPQEPHPEAYEPLPEEELGLFDGDLPIYRE